MKSRITGGPTEKIFTIKVLNKYDVNYYKCIETDFIQTDEPYWLEESYSSAITKLDIGLAGRNEMLRNKVIPILSNHFSPSGKYLDYAGGYGLFTRMMRDKGYDFYHTDVYCKNIFAEYFELQDVPENHKFELTTAFEVFEHLANPIEEIEKILKYSDNLLFTTSIHPEEIEDVKGWWYLIPETGQHVALYSIKSLQFIADKFGFHFYTDGINTHLLTRKALTSDPFEQKEIKLPFFIKIMKGKVDRYLRKLNPNYYEKNSLLEKDFNYIKSKIS